MPLPISPGPDSGSRSSQPDDALPQDELPVSSEDSAAAPQPSPEAASADAVPKPPSPTYRAYLRPAGRAMIGAAAVGFACLVYAYLTIPDVRPLRATNPSTTAFIELRAEGDRSRGETPRRVQKWVRYHDISPELKRAVLVAEDDAFW